MTILPHHSHLLRQRRAAHRPHVHHYRRRVDHALQAHAGLRRRADHRHRRARRKSRARRRGSRQVAGGIRDVIADEFRSSGRSSTSTSTASSPHHRARSITRRCSDLFQRCLENGYIYKGCYTGQYCVFDELYVNDAKPGDPCPDCGRPTETVTEENYFFKLSAFQDRLLELYETQPDSSSPRRAATK